MVCRGKGEGLWSGAGDVRALRIPSVVSRVLRYGDVKKWRVSEGRSRERSFWPASSAWKDQLE